MCCRLCWVKEGYSEKLVETYMCIVLPEGIICTPEAIPFITAIQAIVATIAYETVVQTVAVSALELTQRTWAAAQFI